MTTPVVTVDIDGVLADGTYIPEWDRYPEKYRSLGLIDPQIPEILHELCRNASVYLVSSRHFPDALGTTRLWLQDVGIRLSMLAGVICGIDNAQKPLFTGLLHSACHIDDHPRVVDAVSPRGILCLAGPQDNWWEGSIAAANRLPTIYSWQELPAMLDSILAGVTPPASKFPGGRGQEAAMPAPARMEISSEQSSDEDQGPPSYRYRRRGTGIPIESGIRISPARSN